MPIEYFEASDIKQRVDDIIEKLEFFHIISQHVFCVRSKGSTSHNIIARIHGFGRIWQEILHLPPSYIIEVISEQYDQLTEIGKEKTLIHELLHIPDKFSGGFRPHKGYIDEEKIEFLYRQLKHRKNDETG